MIAMLDRVVRGLLLALVIAMIATVSWQVFSRYLLRAPSSVTEELARFQLIWLGLFGSVYTFRNRMHVGIDVLTASLSGRRKVGAEVFSLAVCALFAVAVLVYGGAKLVWLTHTLNQVSPTLGFSIAWVYAVIPISGVLIVIYAIYFTIEAVHGHVHGPVDPEGVPPRLADGDEDEGMRP